jgi:hypothetical protein
LRDVSTGMWALARRAGDDDSENGRREGIVPISLSGGDANEMERSMDPCTTWANPQARSGKDPCKFHPLGVELRRRWAAR